MNSHPDVCTFDQIDPQTDSIGGKGLSLAVLARAGFPVPPGFCISSTAQCRLNGQPPRDDETLCRQILEAYHQLGSGPVAVRSSATLEDGRTASFAGQQTTFLGVQGDEDLLDAVGKCWASLDSERSRAYRQHQGVIDRGWAMAVVVQRLFEVEAAGVLFTTDPLDPEGRHMLIEAAWGLGESVVSGAVTPDRFTLDRDTGEILCRDIALKETRRTRGGLEAVPVELQTRPSLNDVQLKELAELGRRVEALFGGPRDIEWAWADGQFWLLQARPISAAPAQEREQARREEIETLRTLAHPDGTVWARYNLAEVLPEPTPMTWAVVRDFLSGKGGFGLMYRDLGCRPDPLLDELGIFDLVCGRPYCNLSREPLFAFDGMPLEHSFAALKQNPARALYPRVSANYARIDWRFWLGLPWMFLKTFRNELRVRKLGRTFADRFRKEIIPAFQVEYRREQATDWAALDSEALLRKFAFWRKRSLHTFARDSLKPTALAGVALANLDRFLRANLPTDQAVALRSACVAGVTTGLGAAVRALKEGRLSRQEFLDQFGHRGSEEMELARPRWAEDPTVLDRQLAGPTGRDSSTADTFATWEEIAKKMNLNAVARHALAAEVTRLLTYMELREEAKNQLMFGYSLLRSILVELDRRNHLAGGIFFLTPEELSPLIAGKDMTGLIASRRRRRRLALSLPVPPVLFSDDLETIGRVPHVEAAATLQGIPLSAGVAEGPALVLSEPAPPPAEPYVLVCPSTDPAWVPLFVGARALVMEVGGVLSHGAIVAREFGLPAVAGLPEVRRRIRTGQRLRVDGSTGQVALLP
jgi:pyruvate,water dikinase